ncbi:small integral membrane protein 26 [Saimiri boliviensis]|uniref:D-aminoacyl-tRNA deacylase 1 n=1 Tax=Saimiri boliviensis boliviensis TaxID=39432 RepID=A0A2K6TGC4_SAIBB|nr:small integral membrane protein 26 [Saimiri boliviensis boliviensis]
MRGNPYTAWYRRMSVVYGLGTWSLLGSLIYVCQRMTKSSGGEEDQKHGSTSKMLSEPSEAPKGFYMETIVTYKENFVPVAEKICSYWKSWTSDRGTKP